MGICSFLCGLCQIKIFLTFFRFRIFNAEGIDSYFFHDLRSHRAVTVIDRSLCDVVYNIHALDDLSECSVSAIEMRGIFVHDKELGTCGVRMHGSCHG